MNSDLSQMIDGIIGSLNENVLPNLADEFARGQVFAAIYLLSEMKIRADFGQGWLREHLKIHEEAFVQIRASGVDGLPPPPFDKVGEGLDSAQLAKLRDEADEYLCALQRWVDTQPQGPARRSLDMIVSNAVRAQAALEVKLTPKPIYSKVARG